MMEESLPLEEENERPAWQPTSLHNYFFADCDYPPVRKDKLDVGSGTVLEVITTFNAIPLLVGDEVPLQKMEDNASQLIDIAIATDGFIVSIYKGKATEYQITRYLIDKSVNATSSTFCNVDAVLLRVSQFTSVKDENNTDIHKQIALTDVYTRVELLSFRETTDGLLYSSIRIISEERSNPIESAVLTRSELAQSKDNIRRCITQTISLDARLVLHYTTSASAERLLSIMKWVPDDIKVEVSKDWKIFLGFCMRNLPIDRHIQRILIRLNCPEAQITLLDSINFDVVKGRCKLCNNVLFGIDDVLYLHSWKSSSAIFVNSAEYIFDTIFLNKRDTIETYGNGSDAYSWFEGYSWRYAICSQSGCSTHLGWSFTSNQYQPSLFVNIQRASFILSGSTIDQLKSQYAYMNIDPFQLLNDS